MHLLRGGLDRAAVRERDRWRRVLLGQLASKNRRLRPLRPWHRLPAVGRACPRSPGSPAAWRRTLPPDLRGRARGPINHILSLEAELYFASSRLSGLELHTGQQERTDAAPRRLEPDDLS